MQTTGGMFRYRAVYKRCISSAVLLQLFMLIELVMLFFTLINFNDPSQITINSTNG